MCDHHLGGTNNPAVAIVLVRGAEMLRRFGRAKVLHLGVVDLQVGIVGRAHVLRPRTAAEGRVVLGRGAARAGADTEAQAHLHLAPGAAVHENPWHAGDANDYEAARHLGRGPEADGTDVVDGVLGTGVLHRHGKTERGSNAGALTRLARQNVAGD